MLKRTAIYIRVSTGAQAADGHSLDVQLEQCLQQANTLGLAQRDIEVYREAGASGEDMDRPELTRLLDDATQGKLTHVIVKHPDRLSRNVADKAIIVRQLKQHDVQIVFVDVPDWDQSDEANLLFNIISSIAEYELRQIRRRTLSGKLRAAREGQMMPMGIDPYGYKYESGQFLVDEEEAAFVRLIFDWYVEERLSMRDIAKRLDELGAPTKTRKSLCWSHATIAHILQNEMYIGRYTYNRRKTAKAPLATARGRKRVRRVTGWHPGAEWISYTVPRIVDDETFRRAALRRQAAKRQGCQRNSHEHLLQGKLRCRVCHRVWYAAASKKQGANTTRMYRRPPSTKVSRVNALTAVARFERRTSSAPSFAKSFIACSIRGSGHNWLQIPPAYSRGACTMNCVCSRSKASGSCRDKRGCEICTLPATCRRTTTRSSWASHAVKASRLLVNSSACRK
ncbi:recombinase family protein [Alicyclobacillus fastidiosus]|uniref:recombinase family protein n=1 Tax=Alicyclobacillus fastidiosus TaxID=392011 RepID=UPI0023E93756|nr:recombinase family protein [Alicyclobacillus fastidiosus]GMA62342.1 hypothetical protein GCM10025859_27820 [Alicyclobacillus fastidiosus]